MNRTWNLIEITMRGGDIMFKQFSIVILAICVMTTMAVSQSTYAIPFTLDGLVLWNRLGSQTEVENSDVGLNGTFKGGGFVQGVFGNAYIADYTQNNLVTFPKEVIPIDAGTIEFWARLTGFPSTLGAWGQKPSLAQIGDGYSTFGIHLNANDGAGNGGLCCWAGHGFTAGTGSYGSWTYEQVLGTGQVENWHHYALVWNKNGIAGVADGTKKVAVFLDGQLNSGRWSNWGNEFVPLTGGELGLISNQGLSQGSVAIDNIKVWNYAKNDYSDRFDPEPIPEPTTILLMGCGLIGLLGIVIRQRCKEK